MAINMLTEEDVANLLNDPSGETRAQTAGKIASAYDGGDLSDSERTIAEQIFKAMVADAEVRVRQALADNLQATPYLPHDVALSLANDVDDVALPILRSSDVLTDDDLISLLPGTNTNKLVAIAGRSEVSAVVADALVETGDVPAVAELVANNGADISETTFSNVVDRFGYAEQVQSSMVHRGSLPITIAERLVTMVSQHLKEELVSRHELPADVAADLVLQSRERATIGLSTESDENSVEHLVSQLHLNGRLTPSIILRAVCMGDLTFFEYSLAERSGVSVINARRLIHDPGTLGLSGIFKNAGLPEELFPAARAAVDVLNETDYDGGENDRERFSRRVIERILTQYGDLGVEMESGDLEYLLAKMNQLPPDTLAA